jgi:hypothetical protein
MTQDHYYGRKRARTGAADVLESMQSVSGSENDSDA